MLKERVGMQNKVISGIMLALLFTGMLTLAINIQPVKSEPTTMIVPDDHEKIQWAIGNASEGDTIFVRAGTYYENVVLNKPNLTLIGENKHTTVVDGNGKTVVSLKGDNAKIEWFTVQNGGFGILMDPWTHGHIISNNLILNNDCGISGHYDCADVSICDNTITSNNIAGIIMLFSHSVISDNLISDNGEGEYQEYGSGIQIVRGVMNSKVVYCINNTIFGNTIKNHQIGIWAIRYSEENLFFHNNFVNNTRQFSVPETTWNNTVVENYWSDYVDVDQYSGPYQNQTGCDGIWDHPYVIDENSQDKYPLVSPYWYWSDPIVGDINKDVVVDVDDIITVALSFGSCPDRPDWNPIADLTEDGIVDIDDVVLVAIHFGETA